MAKIQYLIFSLAIVFLLEQNKSLFVKATPLDDYVNAPDSHVIKNRIIII